MTLEERVAKIKQARALIIAATEGCDSPQIETMLRGADMELYLALWNLGEAISVRPELDYADRS